MKKRLRAVALSLALALPAISFFSWNANATTINILDVGDSGTAADGTVFMADPNPTNPSTGTGVFSPFDRLGAGNGALYCVAAPCADTNQLGFNTDANGSATNFDTKGGSGWTRSVQFSELGTIGGYYVLSLDANQLGCATCTVNQITITNMEIFIGPGLANPEATGGGINNTGYSGTLFDGSSVGDTLLGLAPVWSLDSATNGDTNVLLQASICDSTGQCGSGHGDLDVFIPKALLGSHAGTDNFVLYTEYSGANDGYEEWRVNTATVPEPSTLLLLGPGLLGFGLMRRKRKT